MIKKITLLYNKNVDKRLLINFDFFNNIFSNNNIIFEKKLFNIENQILLFNNYPVNINIFFNIMRSIYIKEVLKKECTTVVLYE